jgi:hypothetical protein
MSRKTPFDLFCIECSEGWASLYLPLIAMAEEQGATVLQVKEKFGGLRFYVEGGDATLEKAIEEAEVASFKTCEVCGAAGEPTKRGYWIRTLCPACSEKRHATPSAQPAED